MRAIEVVIVLASCAVVGCQDVGYPARREPDASDSDAGGTTWPHAGHGGETGSAEAGPAEAGQSGAGGADGEDAGAPPDADAGIGECRAETSPAPALEYCARCGNTPGNLCCTAQGVCCADAFSELPRLDFGRCVDGNVCKVPGGPFGPTQVSYAAGAWIPAASADRSGIMLNGTVQSGARIRIGARLQISARAACDGCVELVGVGLAVDPEKNVATPDLSIVASSELSQLLIATGSKILWSTPIDAAPHSYELERDPDGSARFRIDGQQRAALRIPLTASSLSAFTFGRTDERVPPEARSRVRLAYAGSARCERTADWDEDTPVTLQLAQVEVRAATLVSLLGVRWLAYESAGTIYTVRSDATPDAFTASGPPLAPGEQSFESRSVGDPEWVVENDGLALYYTAVGVDGVRSVGRARFDGIVPSKAPERAALLGPAQLGTREILGPSVLREPSGILVMVVTALDADGTARLILLESRKATRDAPGFDPSTARTLLTVRKGATKDEFTALGTADIVYRRGHFQVYFSAMNSGARVISLLVSNNLSDWVSAGVVLTGSGIGLEGWNIEDPETFVDGDALRLFYTAYQIGKDGQQVRAFSRLGYVSRTSAPICGGLDCGAHTDCLGFDLGSGCACALGYVLGNGQCVPSAP